MKKSSFYIPPGYVATRCELVFMFLCGLVMFGVGLMMWAELIEIPPVPQKLVLRSAYVTHSLGGSKSSVYLYFNVGEARVSINTGLNFPVVNPYRGVFINTRNYGWLQTAMVVMNLSGRFMMMSFD